MANELQLEHEKLTNQARFIQMIVSKELIVSGRKKADIVSELRKKNFRPFPKISKAKAAGENEEALDDLEAMEAEEQETGATTDFDYLLGMAIYSLTKEKIDKLLEQGRQKEEELLALLEKTPSQLWNSDLDAFVMQWEVRYPLSYKMNQYQMISIHYRKFARSGKNLQSRILQERRLRGSRQLSRRESL